MSRNKAVQRKARLIGQVKADRAANRKRIAVQRTARVARQVEADRATYQQRGAIQRVTLQQRIVVQRENRPADQVEADRTANQQRVAVQRKARSADAFKKVSLVKKKLEGVPVDKAAIVNKKT
jgi:hypothetical protein